MFQAKFSIKFHPVVRDLIKYFNFDLQVSPFFDMSLGYNKITQKWFHPKDGFYAGGVEFLVYPLKWSSITVRASLGVDLKGASHEANFLEGISKNKEIFIGIGLHY